MNEGKTPFTGRAKADFIGSGNKIGWNEVFLKEPIGP